MKQTIKELATGDTTTSSAGISTLQGKMWLKEILEAAKKRMYFEQFAYISDLPQGNKDLAVPIATSNITFTATTAEATARTMTQIDNLNTVTFTPATKKFGVAISRDVVRTSQVDVVRYAREQLVYDASLTIDTDIATAIGGASSPAATLFGGDATTTGTLETGDVITTDLVAKAARYLKQNGWLPENDRPFALFIAPQQEEAFLKDSQFVNASEYGGNEVVMNGEIGRYLGIKVVVTNQVPAYTNWGSGALAGHVCFLLKAKVAYGLVYGERPRLDSEYKKNEAYFGLYLDMTYQAKTLQENAIALIKVSDA